MSYFTAALAFTQSIHFRLQNAEKEEEADDETSTKRMFKDTHLTSELLSD